MSDSRLQQALAGKPQVWGGWITGPSFAGPDEFARAGYDYVGFDIQHGYLDDADVAVTLRRIEHVPIATAVRVPSPAPAPIGRVLDAGADAIIVAMVDRPEQAADAVAATRFAPEGIRSFGPLQASLGHDPVALASRVSVFAMIETMAGLDAVADICAAPGLAGVYVGPADLAISLGVGVVKATGNPKVLDAMVRVQQAATAAGVVSGIHAGDGVTGKELAALGFQMITLAPESGALRRGATAHLAEAEGRA
ncbi:aldolase/citrate lyase family protein [Mycobacterium sp. CVI_P3]|uniref:Aldolase/citrate lyase family protein n=1 Tax=Mycobacterium pinniadriaticum TaxID=2994102 RepID=A0ABT3SCJ8_9MYCO|nr:aldolase/citrate lyase family protein [Mycobacterium pinniadriaticum]MCX2930802.1 aldolase/citrate lyase family protein [Mycobacterium pinniadriaticum]MCX2937226.1 aldolase/citrate lyase family protein [Mycobacterium pinniadriaticum]